MPVYSHSRLSTFETCPLQYKLGYIDKIKREEEGIEAFLGSRFHETMDKLYEDLKCKLYTLDELISYFEKLWDKEYTDNVIITRKDRTVEDYKNIGKKCIEDYYKRYKPFNQGRVLGLEKQVFVDLKGDGNYKVQGYIDRITQADDDTYEIHDYKTSGYIPEQKYLDGDRQLALYQIAIQNMWNDVKKTKLIWHFVAFDKEMSSTRTQEQLDQLKDDVVRLIDQIETTKKFLPQESELCKWCVYPDLCPKKKHLYKVEALPVNEYLDDDGVKLVDIYSDLAIEKKKLQGEIYKIDEEMNKVKEAVIKYSEREEAEVIRGRDSKLRITERTKVSSPSKGSPERKAFEDELKALEKWDEISTVDTNAIEKVVNEERWDKKVIDKIRKFLSIEKRKSVYLSKLRKEEK